MTNAVSVLGSHSWLAVTSHVSCVDTNHLRRWLRPGWSYDTEQSVGHMHDSVQATPE